MPNPSRITGPLDRPETTTERVQSWWDLLTGPWRTDDHLTINILRRLNRLEIRMSKIQDALAEVDAETTALAARIDTVMERAVAQLDADTANELRGVRTAEGDGGRPQQPGAGPGAGPEEPLPPVEPSPEQPF